MRVSISMPSKPARFRVSTRFPALPQSHPSTSRRYSRSSQPPKYHEKVRAFPFAASPQTAINDLGVYPLAFSSDLHRRNALAVGSAALASFTGGKHGHGLQPSKVVAAYFPAWIVDAEFLYLDTQAVDTRTAGTRTVTSIQHAYVPGAQIDPLSYVSFNHVQDLLSGKHSVPSPIKWNESLEVQHEMKINCETPFQFAPLLDRFRLPFEVPNIPVPVGSAIELDFLAAYPMLVPLYLIEYEYEDGATSAFVYEAHVRRAWLASAPPPPPHDSPIFSIRDSREKAQYRIGRMSALLPTNFEMNIHHHAVGDFDVVDDALSATGVPPRVFPDADMDDLRVRPFEPEEVGGSWARMHASAVQRRGASALERIKIPPGFRIPHFPYEDVEAISKLSAEDLDAQLVPWWVEWKAKQGR